MLFIEVVGLEERRPVRLFGHFGDCSALLYDVGSQGELSVDGLLDLALICI